MIDLQKIETYQENNRIEAKRATGGFPQSLWETYSAFANTIGGIILLGVIEKRDHTLSPIGLPDPEGTVREFWEKINDPKIVSVNILREQDVQISGEGERRIVAIEIPRADRHDRPVYLGDDPYHGSYRRNGEGDYHCTAQEVESMLRDQEDYTPDGTALDKFGLDCLSMRTVRNYRARVKQIRPGHIWKNCRILSSY